MKTLYISEANQKRYSAKELREKFKADRVKVDPKLTRDDWYKVTDSRS